MHDRGFPLDIKLPPTLSIVNNLYMYMSSMNQAIFFYIYFVQYGGLLICTLYLHYMRELPLLCHYI
jgi:hypothetical protein